MIPLAYGTYGMAGLPIESALEAVANAGFVGIELTIADGYPGCEAGEPVPADRIRALLDCFELELVAVLLKTKVLGPGALDADAVRRIVDTTRRYGMSLPILTFTMGGKNADWPAERERLRDSLAQLGDAAVEVDAVLAVEPHVGGLIDSVDKAAWLMDAASHPAVRLNFDVSHFALPGREFDIEQAARRLCAHAVHAHIKDSVATGDGFRFVLPGEGGFDLVAYFATLMRLGWTRPVTVEVSAMVSSRPDYQPLDAVGRCFAVLDAARRQAASMTSSATARHGLA